MNHLLNHNINNSSAVQTFGRRSWIAPTDHLQATENRESLFKTLLGFFKDDTEMSQEYVQENVNLLWITNGPVEVTKLGKIFMFKFTYNEDKDYVARYGPKNINGALLYVDYWTPNISLEEFKIHEATFWVEIRKLPLEYFDDKELIEHLFSIAGQRNYVEWNSPSILAKQSV